MTRPHITRTDGQIRLTYTAPMITVILTDEQARELLGEMRAALQADLPTSQIDLPTSHPEIPHIEGWTRVCDKHPDSRRLVWFRYDDKRTSYCAFRRVDWSAKEHRFVTHWRYYTEAP